MKKFLSLILCLSMLLCLCSCGSTDVSNQFDSTFIKSDSSSENSNLQPDAATPPDNASDNSATTGNINQNSKFEVHFIDVGQGDSALVLCDDKTMLIDGGKSTASDIVYTYLKKQNITSLDLIVMSHADDDHIGGLSAPLSTITVKRIIGPKTTADTKSYKTLMRKISDNGLSLEHPVLGSEMDFASAKIKFLGPVTDPNSERNNSSVVMKITYGSTSFLFTGDAAYEEEKEILNRGYDISATVLKVGHHGSASSTSYSFLREIMPRYAVISVGNNSYGHPTDSALSRLRDAGAVVYRTDMQGDIIAKSDGSTVSFFVSKNQNAETNPTTSAQNGSYKSQNEIVPAASESISDALAANDGIFQNYIGNIKTKKFHLPSCSYLPAEKNRKYISSRSEAVSSGFVPCKRCNP